MFAIYQCVVYVYESVHLILSGTLWNKTGKRKLCAFLINSKKRLYKKQVGVIFLFKKIFL